MKITQVGYDTKRGAALLSRNGKPGIIPSQPCNANYDEYKRNMEWHRLNTMSGVIFTLSGRPFDKGWNEGNRHFLRYMWVD